MAKADGWAGVKFFYALDVDPGTGADAARVVVRLSDQTPLLLDKRIGEGRVVLLTSGLDNLTNDFPVLRIRLYCRSLSRLRAIWRAANGRAAHEQWTRFWNCAMRGSRGRASR